MSYWNRFQPSSSFYIALSVVSLKEQLATTTLSNMLLLRLYEDDNARRQLQLQYAGYSYDMPMQYPPYAQPDPFAVSNNIAPPSYVQGLASHDTAAAATNDGPKPI
uniref:Uncharacterized protein n=1 Tax=Kalanchoe fedtschenkoi TaxID=63787 RepID=A0A7N0R8X8_KALFE